MKIITICLKIALLLSVFVSISSEANKHAAARSTVPAKVISVYDGDTFKVDAYPWPDITIRISVRVRGIDTPEIRGKCIDEKAKALKARDFTKKFIDKEVMLYGIIYGKYARRVVAYVLNSKGEDLSTSLIKNKLAYKYDGGTKKSWCE